MNIIYCHHAQRNRGTIPSQNDDITALGEQDAKLFAEMLKNEDDVKVSKFTHPPFLDAEKQPKSSTHTSMFPLLKTKD